MEKIQYFCDACGVEIPKEGGKWQFGFISLGKRRLGGSEDRDRRNTQNERIRDRIYLFIDFRVVFGKYRFPSDDCGGSENRKSQR